MCNEILNEGNLKKKLSKNQLPIKKKAQNSNPIFCFYWVKNIILRFKIILKNDGYEKMANFNF
jgi:hypothetical protein